MRNGLKQLLITFLLLLTSSTLIAQKKWTIGLGAQTFRSKIYRANDKIPPFIEQGQVLSYGAHFIIERKLSPNKSIDVGLGVLKIKNDIFIDYSHDNSETRNFLNTMNIERDYITIPVNFNYLRPLASNLQLKTSIGLQTNILFNLKDDYISPIEVGYTTITQYNRVNILGKARLGLVYGQKNQPNIDINLFANYGLNSFNTKNTFSWLPYYFFSKSLELQFGFELNYFFSH